MQENLFLLHATNKDTDQPVHLQSDQHLCYSLSEKYDGFTC